MRLFAHFYICMPSTLWYRIPDHAPYPVRRWSEIGGTFLHEIIQGSRDPRKCKGKIKRYGVGKGVLSTALSSSCRLPFICSQLLRMHCSRWAVPPVPTPPWPTCKDWALYCAVLQRFCQHSLLCIKRHRWASFHWDYDLANMLPENQA